MEKIFPGASFAQVVKKVSVTAACIAVRRRVIVKDGFDCELWRAAAQPPANLAFFAYGKSEASLKQVCAPKSEARLQR